MSHSRFSGSGLISNWEGGVTYRPNSIVRVKSIDDVVRVVTSPDIYSSPVRAVGTLHSPARCSADDGGTMLDMTGMNRIIEIGEDYVTAEAGAIYVDVAEALAERGLQFHINTEIGNITLGAAACAATKDSSLIGTSHFGQVSSFVSGVKVVLPDGRVRGFNEDEHPEEMRLLRSSYGLLGVIVEVTLRAIPATALHVRHKIYTLAEFRAEYPELVRQGYSVMTYMFPFADRIVVELRKETDHPRPGGAWRWALRNSFWRKWAPYFALNIGRVSPNAAIERALLRALHRIMRRGLSWFVRGEHLVSNAQIIRYPDDPGPVRYVFSMWSFEERRYFDVLEAYFRFCHDYAERTGFRCDLPAVGYRIVRDQNALLSYSHDANVVSIDPVSTGGPGWDEFLKAYNRFCSQNGGYPMLNQTKHLTAQQVREAFGIRLEAFARIRAHWDPEGRLLSSYFADFLGGLEAELREPARVAAGALRIG